jgi:DNA repair photolyase
MVDETFEHHSDYSLIVPGKSWVFVNPSHGCPLGCPYCIEKKDKWFKNRVTPVYSAPETLRKIEDSPLVLKHKSPLTFYNYSDPFLKENKKDLIHILESLDQEGWNNMVGLISKVHPGEDYLERLSRLKNLRLGLFVSYANLPSDIERVSSKDRISLMGEARSLGIKTVGYVRPLISAWTDIERVRELGAQMKGGVDAISLSSIRLTPEIVKSLEARGIEIPKIKTYTNKQRETPFFKEVTTLLKEMVGVPVFWHTSCAMSYLHGEPDYNSHDIRDKRKESRCLFPCVDVQRKVCRGRSLPSGDEDVEELLKRIGKETSFKRDGNTIILNGEELTLEDVSFVRHILPEFVIENGS